MAKRRFGVSRSIEVDPPRWRVDLTILEISSHYFYTERTYRPLIGVVKDNEEDEEKSSRKCEIIKLELYDSNC
jgi:hypothetical protein